MTLAKFRVVPMFMADDWCIQLVGGSKDSSSAAEQALSFFGYANNKWGKSRPIAWEMDPITGG